MADKMTEIFYRVAVTVADIIEYPDELQSIGKNDSQLIYGERITIENKNAPEGWVYVSSCIDDYKGHIRKDFIQAVTGPDTHFVEAIASHIYPEPSFKTRPVMPLSFLSRLRITDETETDGFVKLDDGGWVFKEHILPVSELKSTDHVETALRFLGTPYLYGGRTSTGIDCSALVQLSMMRNGEKCVRDSGPQKDSLGKDITGKNLQYGDFVFFPGHVGIMQDKKNVINANARHMAVSVEPLDELIKVYGPMIGTRRLKL